MMKNILEIFSIPKELVIPIAIFGGIVIGMTFYIGSLLSELLVKASHLCNFTQDTQIVSLKTR